MVVTATATLRSRQGLWDVWCRGLDNNPSDAYLFLISHTAAVQITLTGFQDGTGWKHFNEIDVSQPITVSARYADTPGAPVQLTMAVNGRQVLSYRPRKLLGPGYSGITTQPFGDVTDRSQPTDSPNFVYHNTTKTNRAVTRRSYRICPRLADARRAAYRCHGCGPGHVTGRDPESAAVRWLSSGNPPNQCVVPTWSPINYAEALCPSSIF